MDVQISLEDRINDQEALELYRANGWSSAEKPTELLAALRDSDTLATARIASRLVGLGNAISDGHLVVYYPHLLVHPDFQREGVGRKIMEALLEEYSGFHQHMVTSDGNATAFYRKLGFERAGQTEPMWIYSGQDH